MKQSLTTYILAFLAPLLLFCSTNSKLIESTSKTKDTLPNIIFYLADDQDQLDYGCYGNPKVHTPAVDQLAKEGMRFTNAYVAQSICAPSRSQIYTGLYSVQNGCFANHLPVKPSVKSVTTYLKEAGYDVVLAGKSHVKPTNVFDWTHYFPSINHRFLPMKAINNYLKTTEKPFCMFVASDFPHGPYPKKTNYTDKDIFQLPYNGKKPAPFKKGYYQNIKDDNTQLEKVLEMVAANGYVDRTLFVYASDHGITGKWGVSEPGLRVPLVVRWPGVIKANTTSDVLVSLIDILPTFLEVVAASPQKSLDGSSFYKTLLGDETPIHDYIYGIATKQNIQKCAIFPSRMIRGEQYKYIRNYNAKEVLASNLGDNNAVNAFIKKGANYYAKVPYEELYDLHNDPYEKRNLAKQKRYQKEKKRLIEALDAWMISQNDFLTQYTMPLLPPTLHPLDRVSKWNKIRHDMEGSLQKSDYIKVHYKSKR
ncbi:MAG: sulfatase family protein [Flavicella sp.]